MNNWELFREIKKKEKLYERRKMFRFICTILFYSALFCSTIGLAEGLDFLGLCGVFIVCVFISVPFCILSSVIFCQLQTIGKAEDMEIERLRKELDSLINNSKQGE